VVWAAAVCSAGFFLQAAALQKRASAGAKTRRVLIPSIERSYRTLAATSEVPDLKNGATEPTV
jgi:hypothetical protein